MFSPRRVLILNQTSSCLALHSLTPHSETGDRNRGEREEYGGEQMLTRSNSSLLCLSLCHTIVVHCTGLERPRFALRCLSYMQSRPWVPFTDANLATCVHHCRLPLLGNPTFLNIGFSHEHNISIQVCFGLFSRHLQNDTANIVPGPAQCSQYNEGRVWTLKTRMLVNQEWKKPRVEWNLYK